VRTCSIYVEQGGDAIVYRCRWNIVDGQFGQLPKAQHACSCSHLPTHGRLPLPALPNPHLTPSLPPKRQRRLSAWLHACSYCTRPADLLSCKPYTTVPSKRTLLTAAVVGVVVVLSTVAHRRSWALQQHQLHQQTRLRRP
jgi:hypothetical protein